MRAKSIMSYLGATLAVLGYAGLGGACEGHGSFITSAVVFAIGIGLCLSTWKK